MALPLVQDHTDDDLNNPSADWQMIPDGDGHLHLVDINQMDIEPAFDAWRSVRLLLITRQNRNSPLLMQHNNTAQLRSSPFNAAWPTRFIIHGWNNNGNSGVNTAITRAYLDRGNYNVFVVDWGVGANTANYAAARNRIRNVAHFTAQFIDFLHTQGVSFASITVVGHSLGGHAAGITGKLVNRGRLANVVALDPANPLFYMNRPAERVHTTDANFVLIIHTDTGRLGFEQPLGHASFYPNWGRSMPGCGRDMSGACGHSRAWEFFAASISTANGFWGTRCAGFPSIRQRSCPASGASQLMGGEPVVRAANGVYFLETSGQAPFFLGRR